MKTIAVLALSAFLSVTIVSSFSPAYAAARGAMSGKGDFATKGYNQPAKEKKAKSTKMVKPKPQ
jgi:hypothetical protein